MRNMTAHDRKFLEDLLCYSARLNNGYYCFQPRNKRYGNTKYKRSRVIMQLHLNQWLDRFEIVHHKDGDRTNDLIHNLEVQTTSEHLSNHHAGSKKVGLYSPSNKLKKEKVIEIKSLGKKILKSDGSPNCDKIGKTLGISGFTVSKYLKE